MKLLRYAAPPALALVLAACGSDTEPGPETTPPADEPAPSAALDRPVHDAPPSTRTERSQIDWEAARADFAGRAAGDDSNVQIASAGVSEPPAVPILLPSGIVTPQGGSDVRLRRLDDGYFATYPGVKYDIIVNGTNQTPLVEGRPRVRGDEAVFTATTAGAQVALTRYGADYLIEFECNELDAETGGCVTEDEAMDVAERLVVARTR